MSEKVGLVAFLKNYAFDDDAHYELSKTQRRDFREAFPLHGWASLNVEDYAIDKRRASVCYRLQFSTKKVGSMKIGSQKNALIYRESETGDMYYPSEYGSLAQAWEVIRGGFIELFDAAERGDWTKAAQIEAIKSTHGIRMKLLSIYFPDELLAIFSKRHLVEFLNMFEVPAKEFAYQQDIIRLNRKFLAVLRERGFDQPPIRITHGIYRWRDAKESIRRFWIEKAHSGRGRENDEGIGEVLVSGNRSKLGKDIYRSMRAVKPGDLILHLIDGRSISGVSIVDEEFETLDDRQEMRVMLRDYQTLDPVLERDLFLNAQTLGEFPSKGRFFRSDFELNQGAYLTEVPLEMIQKLDRLYFEKYGVHFPHFFQHVAIDTVTPLSKSAPVMTRNIILYGPPGTGKTFSTKTRASELANRPAENLSFQELRNQGRVKVLTFHQSLGYEEFVEGLRPMENEEGVIQFGVEPGLFAEISLDAAAEGVYVDEKKVTFEELWDAFFQKLREHEDEAPLVFATTRGVQYEFRTTERGNIRGYKLVNDTPQKNSLQALKKYNEILWSKRDEIGDDFKNYSSARIRAWVGVGCHESMLWITHFELLKLSKASSGQNSMLTHAARRRIAQKLMAGSEREASFDFSNAKQYVLVIDEINRGNISKILGELITLLEPSKRLTAKDEMVVRLPYSKQAFGVPPNLHIVGTMNTADRSIALLDVALRRRFIFEEMMPDAEVLRRHLMEEGAEAAFVELSVDIFKKINDRIRFLYDRDHQIGHAYFFGASDWKTLHRVFIDRVIPLLEEYFYGDWLRVCAVLGCPYDEDGRPARTNDYPIVSAALSKQKEILGYVPDGMDDLVDFELNPKFLDGSELENFFASILL